MKILNAKKTLKKVISIILASFISALAIKIIVQPNQFLSGGVSGLTILISRYLSISLGKSELESTLYSVLYIIFNIPIFIFGLKKLGKHFIAYSMADVLLFSLFVSIIPSSLYLKFQLESVDLLTKAILAGLLSGTASVIAFSNGFSQGGTDIISMYLSRTKGKGIGNYSLAMNVAILLIGGIVFKNYSSLIYTIIYFFISSLVVNNLYLVNKKMLVEIVTKNAEKLTKRLMAESHHGCTIIDAVGAYSNETKKIIRIVISYDQSKRICEIIKEMDSESFTTIIDVSKVNGRFYISPLN